MTRPSNSLARAVILAVFVAGTATAVQAQQGALYVVQDRVGVGTEAPEASLEVQGGAGTTAILVDENNAVPLLRNLLILENQGPPRIVFTDTSVGKIWRAGAYFGNTFRFDTPSGNGVEAELDQNGNLTIQGTLSQGSSRALKENFLDVDPRAILDRVIALPISSWNYVTEGSGARHLGPVAEDFRAMFDLGETDTHLAPADAAGVALAAIKGLNQVVQADQAEVLELRNENARLRETIEALAENQKELLRRLDALETGPGSESR